ncbi:MAG: hypothetical protein HS116_13660 [Planctomycetes bacterium]|nr:hypothetical protein [Planctomycetota bacterium]
MSDRVQWWWLASLAVACWGVGAVEERMLGTLEKTAKPGACAQITDALSEIYYIIKTPESERACRELMGHKVALVGVVEKRAGDDDYYFSLKSVEAYRLENEREPPPTARPGQGTLPLPPPSPDPAPPPAEAKTANP